MAGGLVGFDDGAPGRCGVNALRGHSPRHVAAVVGTFTFAGVIALLAAYPAMNWWIETSVRGWFR